MIEVLPGNNSNLEQFQPFINVDVIVSDIDGTLISRESLKLGAVKKLLKKLKRKKVCMTIATGRTYFGAKALLEELEIDRGMPIALYNGGIVIEYGTENVLYSKFVDSKELLALFDSVSLESVNKYIYTFEMKNRIFKNEDESIIFEKVYGIGPGEKKYDVNGLMIEWINDIRSMRFSINAVLIEKENLSPEKIYKIEEVLKRCTNLSYTDSGSGFIEIKAKGLSKGTICEILKNQRKLGINKILAIGDNDNDKELFEAADISVAVANSSEGAIGEADYICENVSTTGFIDMLNTIEKAKKYCND